MAMGAMVMGEAIFKPLGRCCDCNWLTKNRLVGSAACSELSEEGGFIVLLIAWFSEAPRFYDRLSYRHDLCPRRRRLVPERGVVGKKNVN